MKALRRDLQSVVKTLKSLTKKTEQIAKALEKIETPRPAKKKAKREVRQEGNPQNSY